MPYDQEMSCAVVFVVLVMVVIRIEDRPELVFVYPVILTQQILITRKFKYQLLLWLRRTAVAPGYCAFVHGIGCGNPGCVKNGDIRRFIGRKSLKTARAMQAECAVKPTFLRVRSCYGNAIENHTPKLNVIGPQVRRFREQKGWTQEQLAVKLQLFGWDTSRDSITKLENQDRRVPDLELFVLAKVLGVATDDLFPRNLRGKIKALWSHYRVKLSRGQVPPGQ